MACPAYAAAHRKAIFVTRRRQAASILTAAMKDKKLTNREIDEAARRLINAAVPRPAEIESVVSNPRLFDGVMARIAAMPEQEALPVSRFSWKPVFASVFAAAAVSVPMIAYFSGASDETADLRQRKLPAVYTVNEAPFTPSVPVPSLASAEPEQDESNEPRAEFAVSRPAGRRVSTRTPRRAPPRSEREPDRVFHPIGFSDKAEDAVIDGRVVRVELPRSTLFAMGIDVPLENGTRAVNAELLLGADGAPRAIRLVE